MPRISCVTLPVDDVHRSYAFYRDAMGFAAEDSGAPVPDDDHAAILLEGGLYLVLILRAEFSTFTRLAGQADAAPGASECVLSYFSEDEAEVDDILSRAADAGGAVAAGAEKRPWGYAGYFRDPDGHLWEIMCNPGLQTEA